MFFPAVPAEESKPRVLIVGGEDVDARIELMHRLRRDFHLGAAGTCRALEKRFRENGFPFYYYPMSRGSTPLRDLKTLASLWLLVQRFRPALVHTFDTKVCVYGRLAARLAGAPVVVGTIPGLGSLYVDGAPGRVRRLVRGLYEKLQNLASRLADLTIFQNQEDARDFVGRKVVPACKSLVIPGSGVATELYDAAKISAADRRRVRAELGLAEDAVLATMVARVMRSKGVEEFAAAAQAVRQSHPRTAFLLVGPADEQCVDRFHPQELRHLLGPVLWPGPRGDIPAVLAASDVFVLPSFYREGIPRSLLEAASMGLPLVTTRSPGCAEVVVEGVNGFLVPVRDARALASAVARLVENPALRRRFGAESRRLAVSRFDLGVIAEQTRGVYHRLLNLQPLVYV